MVQNWTIVIMSLDLSIRNTALISSIHLVNPVPVLLFCLMSIAIGNI